MKKKVLLFIKYSPVLMAVTCIIKIWMFLLHLPIVSKIINVILNSIIVLGIYVLGRYLSYCKVHKFLCNFALYGYTVYSIYLCFNIPYNNLLTYIHLILYSSIGLFCLGFNYKKLC